MVKVNLKQPQLLVTGRVLRQVSRRMLPFYRKIAGSRSFASQWTTAVVTSDLSRMGRLLARIPALAKVEHFGTNGIGYFISFPFPPPVDYYTNGTTIPPGSVQFTFDTQAHRRLALAVIPLYRKLAASPTFAKSFAAAIRRKDNKAVDVMVRGLVKADSLKSVTIEEHGVALLFHTRFSEYPYRNLLFQETM
ncbi:hypothetical protein [Paenibacillus sp. HW567]|uniref:hypothetical protein n=1 Tax=Paenibacillus sp. HW567 TaxID=1034769 RepID=UPI0003687AD2|nr:hypothetical protein [Paenibacillus sp. HW567]